MTDGRTKVVEGYKRSKRSGYFKTYGARLIERDGPNCVRCGTDENLTVDHIVEGKCGGSMTDLRNMRILCNKCHVRRHRGRQCHYPGCTRTSDVRTLAEEEYGITLCDPGDKIVGHYVGFSAAYMEGTAAADAWIAANLMKECVECGEPMRAKKSDYLCTACRAAL